MKGTISVGWLDSDKRKAFCITLYYIILDSGFCIFTLEIIMMKSLLKPNGNHVETQLGYVFSQVQLENQGWSRYCPDLKIAPNHYPCQQALRQSQAPGDSE